MSNTLTVLDLQSVRMTDSPAALALALPKLVEARFDETSIPLITAVVSAAPVIRVLRMVASGDASVDAWVGLLDAAPSLVVVDSDWVLGVGHGEDLGRMDEIRAALFALERLQCLILTDQCPDDSWATFFSELDDAFELDSLAILNLDDLDRVDIAGLMQLIEVGSLTALSLDGDGEYMLTDIFEVRRQCRAG